MEVSRQLLEGLPLTPVNFYMGESFPLYHSIEFYIMRARFQNNLSLTLCLRVRAKVLQYFHTVYSFRFQGLK